MARGVLHKPMSTSVASDRLHQPVLLVRCVTPNTPVPCYIFSWWHSQPNDVETLNAQDQVLRRTMQNENILARREQPLRNRPRSEQPLDRKSIVSDSVPAGRKQLRRKATSALCDASSLRPNAFSFYGEESLQA